MFSTICWKLESWWIRAHIRACKSLSLYMACTEITYAHGILHVFHITSWSSSTSWFPQILHVHDLYSGGLVQLKHCHDRQAALLYSTPLRIHKEQFSTNINPKGTVVFCRYDGLLQTSPCLLSLFLKVGRNSQFSLEGVQIFSDYLMWQVFRWHWSK